jgi:putative hydrolase of the HAD superfamily
MSVKVVFFDIGDTLVTKKQWLPQAKETIGFVKSAGIRVGLMSNTGTLNREALLDLLPADFEYSMFEEGLVMLSSEIGIEKPNLGIFSLAIHNANVPPEETMFVGESVNECLSAQTAGMKAARITNAAEDYPALMTWLKKK